MQNNNYVHHVTQDVINLSIKTKRTPLATLLQEYTEKAKYYKNYNISHIKNKTLSFLCFKDKQYNTFFSFSSFSRWDFMILLIFLKIFFQLLTFFSRETLPLFFKNITHHIYNQEKTLINTHMFIRTTEHMIPVASRSS